MAVRSLAVLASLLALFACSSLAADPPSCRQVAQMITPCAAFLADRAWAPYGPCCNGVAALNQTAASSLAGRITVCNCLQTIALRMPRVDVNRAAALPRTCGVNFNVTISPYFDCSSLASP